MTLHLLCVGGEDHALRIPFLHVLRDRGFRVSAAGTGDPGPFRRNRIPFHRYQFDRFGFGATDWLTIRHLSRLLRELQPDMVQTFDTKPNLLVPFASRGAYPLVRTINGMGWTFSSKTFKALALRPIYVTLQRLAAFWTSATVFQNLDDRDYFIRYHLLGHGTAALIGSSGIDVGAFERAQTSAGPTDALRAELGLDRSEVVLMVSRLTVQKGIQTLLEAAAIVCKQRPSVRFLLVGPRESEGPFAIDKTTIDRYAPHVTALGMRSDVPALLKVADVFAFPTEYREGIPRALLEAGLAGLPIVTTQMPGCTDLVVDKWNGYLVPPRNPDQLALRILDLLQDRSRARAMGRRSVEFVRHHFDLNSVTARYSDLYSRILSTGHSPQTVASTQSIHQRRGYQRRGSSTL